MSGLWNILNPFSRPIWLQRVQLVETHDAFRIERRDRAKSSIARCVRWWFIGHIAIPTAFAIFALSFATGLVETFAGGALTWIAASAVALPGALWCLVPPLRSAYIAVRHASALPKAWIITGLLPCVILSVEVFGFVIAEF